MKRIMKICLHPSTSASYCPVTRGIQSDPNSTFGLEDSLMFRIFNVFRDQSRQGVIQILRKGHHDVPLFSLGHQGVHVAVV